MLKRQELATHDSCLNRAHDDEPVFVLRANDASAPSAVRAWAAFYLKRKRSGGSWTQAAEDKAREARQLADDMENWRRENRL